MAGRQKKYPQGVNSTPPSIGAAGPTRQLEIETKLELDPDTPLPALTPRKRLAGVGIVAAAEPITYHLDAVYYDTDRLDLLRSKITLRRRTGGADAGWHLKLPAVQGARTEIGLPLSAGDGTQVPAEIAALVVGAARGRALAPVARILNERTVRHLLDGEGTVLVEVADDHVTGEGRLEGHRATRRWREVEAEIIKGTAEQLAATVDVLTAGGARPAASPSKLARALGFQPPEPRRGRTAGDLVIGCIGRQTELLTTADRAVREGGTAAVLDARVLCRRIAAVLTVFAPLFEGPALPDLRASLLGTGAAFDTTRDVQTARHRLVEQLAEEPAPYRDRARTRLEQACDRRLSRRRPHPELPERRGSTCRCCAPWTIWWPIRRWPSAASGLPRLTTLLVAGWRRLQELVESALAEPARACTCTRWVTGRRRCGMPRRRRSVPWVRTPRSWRPRWRSSRKRVEEHLDAQRAAELLASLAIEDVPPTVWPASFSAGCTQWSRIWRVRRRR